MIVSSAGCSDTAGVTVTVSQPPIANISGTSTLCVGVSTTLTASGGDTYTWSSGDTTSNITVSPVADSSFSVTVTDEVSVQPLAVTVTV